MAKQKLPEGFRYGDEVADDGKKWEPQPPEAFEKPRKQREQDPKVYSLREALERFRVSIASRKLQDINLEGMRIGALFTREGLTNEKYLVLYKREKYLHFSRHFPDIPTELKGYGIVCNLKLVYWAALEGHRIAVVFPEGNCYYVDAMDFYRFYEEYETEVPAIPGEIAIPFKMWKRLF